MANAEANFDAGVHKNDPLPVDRELIMREIAHLDAVHEVLASMMLSILDKMSAARLRLQLLNKKLGGTAR